MIDHALIYARHGVRVFPCSPITKQPSVASGHHAASANEATIRGWWHSGRRNAVIGLPCRANGIIVLDGDRHGGSDDGVYNLECIFSQIRFDQHSVPVVATPNNGKHFIFRRPQGLGATRSKPVPGVDVKDNGYVIAAGSVLADGRPYRLLNGTPEQLAKAIHAQALPELPLPLIVFLSAPKPKAPSNLPTQSTPELTCGRLRGLIRVVATTHAGERNNALHWAACRAGEMAKAGLVAEEFAFAMLAGAAAEVGLPSREAAATIRSGLRHE